MTGRAQIGKSDKEGAGEYEWAGCDQNSKRARSMTVFFGISGRKQPRHTFLGSILISLRSVLGLEEHNKSNV